MKLHKPITRRGILHGAAGLAGGMLVGCSRFRRKAPLEKRTADVVVVGAGLSGLVTARELVKAGIRSVTVLEARNRVGGLTVTQEVEGVKVDGGGAWVSPPHERVLALAKEFGVNTVASNEGEGKAVFLFDTVRIAGAEPLLSREESREARQLLTKLEAMAAELPPGAPWNAPRAAEYDKVTMDTWLSENANTVWGKRSILLGLNYTFGCQPEDLSLFRFLAAIQSLGIRRVMSVAGEDDLLFEGGAQSLSLKLAEELGARVILSSPVKRIIDHPSGPARVETEALSIECSRVVIAMMPADAKRIGFEPALPKQKQGLIKHWTGAPDYKAHIVYETPFWRQSGLNGTAIGDGRVIDFIFDSTPPSGKPGVLIAFGAGEELPGTLRGRREAVLDALVTYFGDQALEAKGFVELDWLSEAWSSGCASPLRPGVLSKYGAALREPTGRIHWGGSETSPAFDGYMEGAVLAAERVSAEVVEALKKDAPKVDPAPKP